MKKTGRLTWAVEVLTWALGGHKRRFRRITDREFHRHGDDGDPLAMVSCQSVLEHKTNWNRISISAKETIGPHLSKNPGAWKIGVFLVSRCHSSIMAYCACTVPRRHRRPRTVRTVRKPIIVPCTEAQARVPIILSFVAACAVPRHNSRNDLQYIRIQYHRHSCHRAEPRRATVGE